MGNRTMTNEDLSNLIDCIKIEVGNDVQSGNTTKTTYKLPKEALTEKVSDALVANFEHYESATINNGVLTLVHPEMD